MVKVYDSKDVEVTIGDITFNSQALADGDFIKAESMDGVEVVELQPRKVYRTKGEVTITMRTVVIEQPLELVEIIDGR